MKLLLKTITLITVAFLLSSCHSDERTYYPVKAKGYLYYKDTKEPVPNVGISVSPSFKSWGLASQQITEHYLSDSTGFFCVRFIKRSEGETPLGHTITFNKDNLYYPEDSCYINFLPNEIKGKKGFIDLDTLWMIIS